MRYLPYLAILILVAFIAYTYGIYEANTAFASQIAPFTLEEIVRIIHSLKGSSI